MFSPIFYSSLRAALSVETKTMSCCVDDTGPERNRSEPKRIGSAAICKELF